MLNRDMKMMWQASPRTTFLIFALLGYSKGEELPTALAYRRFYVYCGVFENVE